jgi:hypothetical protein
MIFDTNSSDVILISYPSGGFGNFLYHVLTEFVNETVDVDNNAFNFDSVGKSHNTVKYTEVYHRDPDPYIPNITVTNSENKKILVLCDNGILNDQYEQVRKTFPNAPIIRMCIDEQVKPVIYQTCIAKALGSSLESENYVQVEMHWQDANEDYAKRENFTLFYHNWPFGWQKQQGCINFDIGELVVNPTGAIVKLVSALGLTLIDTDALSKFCSQWLQINQSYFKLFVLWHNIKRSLTSNFDIDISHVRDLHEQGYINYCIESQFNVTIPVYDYKDWFSSTNEIRKLIKCSK